MIFMIFGADNSMMMIFPWGLQCSHQVEVRRKSFLIIHSCLMIWLRFGQLRAFMTRDLPSTGWLAKSHLLHTVSSARASSSLRADHPILRSRRSYRLELRSQIRNRFRYRSRSKSEAGFEPGPAASKCKEQMSDDLSITPRCFGLVYFFNKKWNVFSFI